MRGRGEDSNARPKTWAPHLMGRLALALLILATLAGCGVAGAGALGIRQPSSDRAMVVLSANQPQTSLHPVKTLTAPGFSASAAYLVNVDTGQVYLAYHADDERAMASTTKIMTAMVALTFGKLDQRITVGADAPAIISQGASVAGLVQGDTLTLHDLLYALLLPSGDDAAIAIADGVAGSQARFIALMNDEAALLGLWHTHYNDVHGLDASQHYTTARDLARLALFAMRDPTFAAIVKTPTYSVQGYTWNTTNLLLTNTDYYTGATGVKTGYTGNAGPCLVFAAIRNGRHLLGVLLGEPNATGEALRFTDATALLNWGFAQPK
ncbi:MAG: serine hydrolase [Ktedonobacterales bacterium]